jgi:hypothetical protein
MVKHGWIAAVGGLLLFGSVSIARADLITSITNGGFESATFSGFYSTLAAQRPGWDVHGASGAYNYGAGVWDGVNMHNVVAIPALAGVPAYSGYAGGFITAPGLHGAGTGAVAALSQSLGTVGAADVGKEFQLRADLGARGFETHQWQSTMSVRFTNDLTNFTALGTAGVFNVATPLANTPVGMETRMASYTPGAGDVGKTIYALLHVESQTPFTVDQQQHMVDNVGITVVPEPSALLSVFLGLTCFACWWLRGKRSVAAPGGPVMEGGCWSDGASSKCQCAGG